MGWINKYLKSLVLRFFTLALVVQNGNCKGDEDSVLAIRELGYGDNNGAFVQRNETHFILNGKHHFVNGFNAYWLMYMASDPSTRSKVPTIFQEASQHSLNVARTWAFSDGGYRALQVSPGSYDDEVFAVHTKIVYIINHIFFYITVLEILVNWGCAGT